MHHINPKTGTAMQWLTRFIFKICQGRGRALKLCVIDSREQQPRLLHFISQETFFKKPRAAVWTKLVWRLIGLLTNIHLSIMVCSMLLWCDNSWTVYQIPNFTHSCRNLSQACLHKYKDKAITLLTTKPFTMTVDLLICCVTMCAERWLQDFHITPQVSIGNLKLKSYF